MSETLADRLDGLRVAVRNLNEAKSAYDAWYDGHDGKQFPSPQTVTTECKLRTKCCAMEREVIEQARAIVAKADAPEPVMVRCPGYKADGHTAKRCSGCKHEGDGHERRAECSGPCGCGYTDSGCVPVEAKA